MRTIGSVKCELLGRREETLLLCQFITHTNSNLI